MRRSTAQQTEYHVGLPNTMQSVHIYAVCLGILVINKAPRLAILRRCPD